MPNESKATMLICTNAGGATQIIAPATDGKMFVVRNTSRTNDYSKDSHKHRCDSCYNKDSYSNVYWETDYIKIAEV